MKLNLIAVIVVALLISPVCSSSIGPGSVLKGYVKEYDGSAAEGVTIQITNLNNSYSRATLTNEYGAWATVFYYSSTDYVNLYAENSLYYGNITRAVDGNLTVVLDTLLITPIEPTNSPGSGSVIVVDNNIYVIEGYVFIDNSPAPNGVEVSITNLDTNTNWVTSTVDSNDDTNYFVDVIYASPDDVLSITATTSDGYTSTVEIIAVETTPHPLVNIYIKTGGESTAENNFGKEETISDSIEKIFDKVNLEESSIYIIYIGIIIALCILIISYLHFNKRKIPHPHVRHHTLEHHHFHKK